MNVSKIDLNLFVVFDAVYTTRNLTRASEILCITQPAVSNALARLRDMFNDPLFVRTGNTMTPTPVAKNAIGPAREALRLLQTSVNANQYFDPATAEITFSFSMGDLYEAAIYPRLYPLLAGKAPNVRLNNFKVPREEVASALASGQLDFSLDGPAFHNEPDICRYLVAQDRYVLAARRNHPAVPDSIALEEFLALQHVGLLQDKEQPDQVEMAMERLGLRRNTMIQCNHLMTIPVLLMKSDLVACVPYHFCKHFDLHWCELPFEPPRLEYTLYWHLSVDQDPSHRWMREQLTEAVQNMRAAVDLAR